MNTLLVEVRTIVARNITKSLSLSLSLSIHLGLELDDVVVGVDILGAVVLSVDILGANVLGADVLGADALGADVLDDVLSADVLRADVLSVDISGIWLSLVLDIVVEGIRAPSLRGSRSLSASVVPLRLEDPVLNGIVIKDCTIDPGVGLSLGRSLGRSLGILLRLDMVGIDILGIDILNIYTAEISHVVVPGDIAHVWSHVVGTNVLGGDMRLCLVLSGVVVVEQASGVGPSLGGCLGVHTLKLLLRLVLVGVGALSLVPWLELVGVQVRGIVASDIGSSISCSLGVAVNVLLHVIEGVEVRGIVASHTGSSISGSLGIVVVLLHVIISV